MSMQISISNAIGGGGGAQGSGGGSSFASTNSFAFDGIDDYVTMGNVSNLNFQRTDAFSISTWVKRGAFTETQILFSKMNSSGNYRGYMFYISESSDVPQFLLRRDTSFTSQRLLVVGSTTILDNNWHNLVVTYDGSSTASGVKIYVDGISDTTTFTGAISDSITTPAPVNIGARNNNDYFNDFSCDEVSVFNSQLLASDITTIYNSGVPNDITSLSPLSWWRMGEEASYTGKEWVLTDQGSGGNDGFSNTLPAPPAQPSTDVPT